MEEVARVALSLCGSTSAAICASRHRKVRSKTRMKEAAAALLPMLVPPSFILRCTQEYVNSITAQTPGYLLLKEHGSWHYNDGSIHPQAGVNKCFHNIYVTTFQNLGYAMYGFAMSTDPRASSAFDPVCHAWRLQESGVVELTPTWNKPTWYFGIKVPDALVLELCRPNKTYAMLDLLFASQWASNELNDRLKDAVIQFNPQTTFWRELFSDPDLLYRVLCFAGGAYPMTLKGAFRVNKEFHSAVNRRFERLDVTQIGADEDIFDTKGTIHYPLVNQKSFAEATWGYVKKMMFEYNILLHRHTLFSKKWLALVLSFNVQWRFLHQMQARMIILTAKHPAGIQWQDLYNQVFSYQIQGDTLSWEAKLFGILEEARNKFYMDLCNLLELPPDENTIRPRPPKSWPLHQTYIVFDTHQNKVWGRNMETNKVESLTLDNFDAGHALTCIDTYGKPRCRGVTYRNYNLSSDSVSSDSFNKSMTDSISDGFRLDPDFAIVGAVFLKRRA